MNADTRKMIVRATLQWCNERRAEKGLEPLGDLPKGRPWDGVSCPCGRACGYYVGYIAYFEAATKEQEESCLLATLLSGIMEGHGPYSWSNKLGDIPMEVRQFARAFDEGEFPEYQE